MARACTRLLLVLLVASCVDATDRADDVTRVTEDQTSHLVVADFDGDGMDDVVSGSSPLTFLRNAAPFDPPLERVTGVTGLESCNRARPIMAFDVDGDSLDDLVVWCSDDESLNSSSRAPERWEGLRVYRSLALDVTGEVTVQVPFGLYATLSRRPVQTFNDEGFGTGPEEVLVGERMLGDVATPFGRDSGRVLLWRIRPVGAEDGADLGGVSFVDELVFVDLTHPSVASGAGTGPAQDAPLPYETVAASANSTFYSLGTLLPNPVWTVAACDADGDGVLDLVAKTSELAVFVPMLATGAAAGPYQNISALSEEVSINGGLLCADVNGDSRSDLFRDASADCMRFSRARDPRRCWPRAFWLTLPAAPKSSRRPPPPTSTTPATACPTLWRRRSRARAWCPGRRATRATLARPPSALPTPLRATVACCTRSPT